ncbi:hypothetical protein A2U01_0113688, partial [Trifolium medium]|nr:hypothetical protein [Trifolium medium]
MVGLCFLAYTANMAASSHLFP